MLKYIILILLLLTGCTQKEMVEEKYTEESITYDVGESKVIKEEVKAKDAYDETVLSGRTTGWGLKSKYVVGYGKDIEPGTYDIVANGWAEYNIFLGAVELDFGATQWYSSYSGFFVVGLGPLEIDVCYINEHSCGYKYEGYKRIDNIKLEDGDVIYSSYSPDDDQWVNIRFEAQYITVHHDAVEAEPEVRVEPLKVKESVRKYSNNHKCYINDYEVSDCASLKHYNELKEKLYS